MSTIKLENIQTRTGSGTITIGASGETVEVASGVTTNLKNGATLSDNILFDTASKGIYLGVTTPTASNLLDDYEEGTFTPEITSTSGSVTHSNQSGGYTKIGRLVYFDIRVTLSAISSPAGNLRIEGLPFVGSITFTRAGLVKFTNINNFTTFNEPDVLGSYIANTDEIICTDNNAAQINANNLQSNTNFDLSGIYQAT